MCAHCRCVAFVEMYISVVVLVEFFISIKFLNIINNIILMFRVFLFIWYL